MIPDARLVSNDGPWRFPLTGERALTLSQRRPSGAGIAGCVEVRDADGALVTAAQVLASVEDPVALVGFDRLGLDPVVGLAIATVLRHPHRYGEMLRLATDPGQPVPPVPPLQAADEVLLRLLGYAHRAGYREGFAAGLLATIAPPALDDRPEARPAPRPLRRGRGLL